MKAHYLPRVWWPIVLKKTDLKYHIKVEIYGNNGKNSNYFHKKKKFKKNFKKKTKPKNISKKIIKHINIT